MKKTIVRAAVIGAGVMGSSIAALLAGRGIHVTLLDIVPPGGLTDEERAKGLTEKDRAFRNRFSQAGYDRIKNPKFGMLFEKSQINNITVGNMSDDLDLLSDCDWVVEAALEDLDVKQGIMETLAAHCRKGTILSTNTSGVSVEEIGKKLPGEFRKTFMGTHFFNPPRYMKLLEIIPTSETDPVAVQFMKDFFEEQLGKTVVLAKDTPNFVANRIGVFAIIDSMHLAENYGFNIPTVDLLCGKVAGRPSSASFRTADLVGIDILCHTSENVLRSTKDEKERKAYAVPWFVTDRYEAKALGDKSGKGFYEKTLVNGKKTILAFDLEKKAYAPLSAEKFSSVDEALKSANKYLSMISGSGKENRFYWENLKDTLLYAARLVPEIADDFREIDKALVAGFNWEIGPFAIWDRIGVRGSVERMKQEGETIPAWVLDRLARGQETFYEKSGGNGAGILPVVEENDSATLRDMGDGVLRLSFHTKGNAIDQNIIDMISRSVDLLSTDRWDGLVIGSEGRFFCAGADLRLVHALSEEKNWSALEGMIGGLQSALLAMKYAEKPVVAAPCGYALGGGAEITMHAAAAVPHMEAKIGLVELSVGLIPGGGGSTELLVRAVNRSEIKTKTALLPVVKRVWKHIAEAHVCGSAAEAVALGYLYPDTHIVFAQEMADLAAKKKVLEMAGWGYYPPARMEIPVLGDFARSSIDYDIEAKRQGGYITEYDSFLMKKLSRMLTGAGLPVGTLVNEEYLLGLERETFLGLCGQEKTMERMQAMLENGRALHN